VIGLKCYGFMWLLICAYHAVSLADLERRQKRLKAMEDNVHIYETMLQSVSPGILSGLFAAVEIVTIGLDFVGFALAYAYVPLKSYTLAAFALFMAAYMIHTGIELIHLKRIRRVFGGSLRPFAILARYLRRHLIPSAWTYLAVYGRCLVSVQLFLNLLKH